MACLLVTSGISVLRWTSSARGQLRELAATTYKGMTYDVNHRIAVDETAEKAGRHGLNIQPSGPGSARDPGRLDPRRTLCLCTPTVLHGVAERSLPIRMKP